MIARKPRKKSARQLATERRKLVSKIRERLSDVTKPDKVTRFEVIDGSGGGRVYTRYGVAVQLSYQDDGRTLKVFVSDRADRSPKKVKDSLAKVLFVLDDRQWRKFQKELDNPPKPNKALIELMKRKPSWEKKP